MIIGLLLQAIFALVNFLVGLLPTGGFPTSIITGIHTFFVGVYAYNGIFPIDTAFQILGITVVFWVIMFGWDFGKWCLHLIRGN